MVNRIASSVLALSLLASSVPAFAAAAVELPEQLPCAGTTGKDRARCITDALKSWKTLEHEYDELEDELIAQWKKEHATMGVGSDYQKALRDFLNGVHAERKEFRKQLNAFRKAFFDEQKSARRNEGTTAKPKPEPKAPAMSIEEAKAKCGPEDDDGKFRTCMRQLLRGVPRNSDRRSRTNTKVMNAD